MQDQEVASAVAKVAPPAVVAGSSMLFGFTLNDWVAIATLLYVCLQMFFLLKDRLKKRHGRRKNGDD